MGKLLERGPQLPADEEPRKPAPTPVDDTEVLNWDVAIEAPPRPTRTVRARIVYTGRAKPLPVPDPEE